MRPISRPSPRKSLLALVLLSVLAGCSGDGKESEVVRAPGKDWPQWRGPDGDGTSGDTNVPVSWDASSGIKWKCPLPAWGDSTPAISGNNIFLTTQVDDRKMLLVKIDKTIGRIEWTREVGDEACPHRPIADKPGEQRRHQSFAESHNFASPSPVTDGRTVVVHFGNGDLAAYDFAGQQLWKRNLQKDYGDYTVWWGHANSPILFDGLVISICLQDSCADLPGKPSPSYIVAHDLKTGRERWMTPRPTTATHESCDSYTTPLLWNNNGRTEVIICGGQILDAYDPTTGKRLWQLPGLVGNRTVTGPVTADGMIFATQGMQNPMLAVRPAGDDQRTRKDVIWRYSQATPDAATPVVSRHCIFFVSNDGIAQCLDAKTGRNLWKKRLKGDYRASPIAADDKIYFLNTRGLTTVVAASSTYRRLAENDLKDDTLASPAVSGPYVFIRGRNTLYCIGK